MAYDESPAKKIDDLITGKESPRTKQSPRKLPLKKCWDVLVTYLTAIGVQACENKTLIIRCDPKLSHETNVVKNVRMFDVTGRLMNGLSLANSEGTKVMS